MMKECVFEGCTNKNFARGWCRSHYSQWYKGRPMQPITSPKRYLHRDETGRVCTRCDTYKPWSEFYGRTRAKCKRCTIKQNGQINRRRLQGV